MQESPKTTDRDAVRQATGTGTGTGTSTVRITTGSRLHFGLLDTAAPFGGVGVMIDQPVTEIVVRKSRRFQSRTDETTAKVDADRIESVAVRAARVCGESALPECEVRIAKRPPAHCGLGSGTQMSLALAEAITCVLDRHIGPESIVTQVANRGKRSAVGSHGYFHGGLIYEEAADGSELNSVAERVEIPDVWRVAILRPTRATTLVSGEAESQQFGLLPRAPAQRRDELRSIITDAMLPAARRQDFDAFTAAVHQYNHGSGELFQTVQGGPYNGPHVTQLVQWLVRQGVRGVGQSSWGPGVFAWFESESQWLAFRDRIPPDVACVTVASVRNQGRERARD
tara:strand:- start:82550 stop:83572 length:1023 start_codon:yes stop_codon:yes gene_type:complete